MKSTLVVLAVGLWAAALATPVLEQTAHARDNHEYKLDDRSYLPLYKNVLRLFKFVHQPTYFRDHVEFAKNWQIESHNNSFTKPEVVTDFLHYYHTGMLPRDEIFSVFYDAHLKQAIALFKLFYYAKDFDTFYNMAIWARYHLNQGMFLYSFSVALIHRPETRNMVLPPIYEIYPYYFFNTEVIHKAQYYKQMWSESDDQEYLIYSNYSGWYMNLHPEQSMSYFTEDIGINSFYYYYNLYRPFWMDNEEYHVKSYNRGEEFYYFYQQLLARYYLERLSNDMGEIGSYDYDDAFETGFYPSLCYPNGMEFPERPNWVYFFTNYYNHLQSHSFKGKYPYSYRLVTEYERRIRDALDAGFIYTEDGQKINLMNAQGFNTLGNIIESNPQSPNTRFYGYLQIFARHLLGYSFQPLHEYKVVPSALEHFETSLRDPAFWMLFKRITLYFQKYKYALSHYKRGELAYPGVKIESVEVDRLMTYFDIFDSDVTNAVYMNKIEWENNNFEVSVRQWRMNHKPFTYTVNVISDKVGQAVVRVFIGPKYDEHGRFIQMDENRMNFVEFDRFKYDLKAGQNVIERNSRKIFYATDRTTYKQLYSWVMSGSVQQDFMMHGSEVYYAFPNRFLLPKGKHGGQMYQFYVIISPYKARNATETTKQRRQQSNQTHEKPHGEMYNYLKYPMVGLGVQYLDDYPLGYPFDRPINEQTFYVPNAYFQDVMIYHKEMDHVDNYLLHNNKMGTEYMPGTGMQLMGSMYGNKIHGLRTVYDKTMYDRSMYGMGAMYGKNMHGMTPIYGKGMDDMYGMDSRYGKGMRPMYGKDMHSMGTQGMESMYGKNMNPMYGKSMRDMNFMDDNTMKGMNSMYDKGMHSMYGNDMQNMDSMYGKHMKDVDSTHGMYGKNMHDMDMKSMYGIKMQSTNPMYGKTMHDTTFMGSKDMKDMDSMYGKGMTSMYGKDMHGMDPMYGKTMHDRTFMGSKDMKDMDSMYGKSMLTMYGKDMKDIDTMYGKGSRDSMDMGDMDSMHGKTKNVVGMQGMNYMYDKEKHGMDNMYGNNMRPMQKKGIDDMEMYHKMTMKSMDTTNNMDMKKTNRDRTTY